MNILITGVTSFIGRALAHELISQGHEVYGVVRPLSKNRADLKEVLPKLHIIQCDMNDHEKLRDMDLPKMYACVHLSWDGAGREGRMDPDRQAVNEKNTLGMVKIAQELGCERFILSGSQAEYGVTLERVLAGEKDGRPSSEESLCEPISEYGKSKLRMLHECNKLCKSYGMTYIHLRIFSVYGVGDHPGTLVSTIAKAFINDESVKLTNCQQQWNFIYITDCAKAIADLINCVWILNEDDEDEDHVVNIASEDTRQLRDFVMAAHEIIGKGSCEFGGPGGASEGTPYLNPDITRLQKLTGYKSQVSFEEGINLLF